MQGHGVEKNLLVAYAIYNVLAAEDAEIAKKRDELDSPFGSPPRLTRAQIRTAQAISVKLQNSDNFLRTLDEAIQQTTEK